MAATPSKAALGHFKVLFGLGTVGALSDAELLERFAARAGPAAELAFAAIVQRHGPMVLGVCRRVLREHHDAEDAFQATFLVLARKARAIRRGERLANWLYGVAHRTAAHARAQALRRRARERPLAAEVRLVGPEPDTLQDLRAVLDEELPRLPGRYRAAVVLCDLEGLGRAEAARRLGVPEGTLSSRLNRARSLLRDRLTRRGLSLGVTGLASMLAGEASARTLSPALVESTVRAAALVAAGCSAAGAVSVPVVTLFEGVLRMMLLSKCKGAALAALTVVLVAGGAGVLAQQAPPDPKADPDRLAQLERKIDRLLETLGDGRHRVVTETAPVATTVPAAVYGRGSASAPVLVPSVSGAARTLPPNASEDRLADLERRLADVEKRLEAMEARLKFTYPAAEKTAR